MQENYPSKPDNNNDEQQHIEPEQNEQQQSASEQEEQIKDTPQEQPSVPSEGGHLPAWLRAEMGDSSPEPQEQQSTEQKSEASSAEREVQQLREQVRGYQHQLASVQRQVHRLEEGANYQAAPERGGCLTAWLIFMGVGSVLGILIALIALGKLGILGLLLLPGAILSLMGVVGTWQFKKWGYYLLMTLYGISLFSSFITLCVTTGGSIGSIVITVLLMLILYLLVRERWTMFE
jgi:hypothetical protein